MPFFVPGFCGLVSVPDDLRALSRKPNAPFFVLSAFALMEPFVSGVPAFALFAGVFVVVLLAALWLSRVEAYQERVSDERVAEAVRKGNEENKRCSLFASLEKQKLKINSVLVETERRKLSRQGRRDDLSREEILTIAGEEDGIALDEFRRHLWIETRGLVREVRQRFPFVTNNREAINTVEHGASSLGDIVVLFSYLDGLSGELLHTLEDVV